MAGHPSQLLNQSKKARNEKILDMLKKISPIAWQHINLYGRYEFHNKSKIIIYIDEIIKHLSKVM
jgi:hypothetical protein